jgi:ADP-ribose pyrophosphatase
MAESEQDRGLRELVLADEEAYSGKLLKVRRLTVQLPNGRVSHREMIRHPGAAAMIALDGEGNLVLERQWRAPLDRAFWEVPAGKIDPGETPFDCARRELIEEAGVKANKWVYLGTMHNAIGYSNERIAVYLAQQLEPVDRHLDDNEFINLKKIPWKEALAMTRDGSITDVKTIIALGWLESYLGGTLSQAQEC